jgi:hypothetical protein
MRLPSTLRAFVEHIWVVVIPVVAVVLAYLIYFVILAVLH